MAKKKKNISDVQRIVRRMVDADKENVKLMRNMDAMWLLDWDLPEQLKNEDWIRKRVAVGPSNAVRNAAAVFSKSTPRVKYSPLLGTEPNRQMADKIERALMWAWEQSAKRRKRLLFELIRHAVLYDKVALQVVFLPYEEKAHNVFGKKGLRGTSAKHYGDYAVILRDPKQVHAEYSDWGMERVVYRSTMPVREAMDFWGDNAKELEQYIDSDNAEDESFVTIYDYTDYDRRVVWASVADSELGYAEPAGMSHIILDEKNELPFIPWVVKAGSDPQMPLLYQVDKGDLWHDLNLYGTIMSSEVIAYAASPRWHKMGVGDVQIDYSVAGGMIETDAGTDLEQLNPPQIDQNLMMLLQNANQEVMSSTLPAVVQGDLPSGTAFATANLATQSGIMKLNPYRELAQEVLEEVFRHMLMWISFTGEAVNFYPEVIQPDNKSIPHQVKLEPGMWDDNHLYIDVDLVEDVPTDRMARMNASIAGMQNLDYSKEKALEDIGVNDATAMIQRRRQEIVEETDFEIMQQQKMAQAQTQIQIEQQQAMFELQMQQQQMMAQMAQQQQQGQPPPQQPGGAPPTLAQSLRNPNVQQGIQGQGFNPQQGGDSSITADPSGIQNQMLNQARQEAQLGIPNTARVRRETQLPSEGS